MRVERRSLAGAACQIRVSGKVCHDIEFNFIDFFFAFGFGFVAWINESFDVPLLNFVVPKLSSSTLNPPIVGLERFLKNSVSFADVKNFVSVVVLRVHQHKCEGGLFVRLLHGVKGPAAQISTLTTEFVALLPIERVRICRPCRFQFGVFGCSFSSASYYKFLILLFWAILLQFPSLRAFLVKYLVLCSARF